VVVERGKRNIETVSVVRRGIADCRKRCRSSCRTDYLYRRPHGGGTVRTVNRSSECLSRKALDDIRAQR
jgi:hypothetical protein